MFIQGNNVYPWSSGRYVPVLNSFLHCALYSTSSYADIPFDMQQDFIHSLLRTCTSKGRARVNLASGILCCRLVWRYLWGGVKEGGCALGIYSHLHHLNTAVLSLLLLLLLSLSPRYGYCKKCILRLLDQATVDWRFR